MKKTKLLVNTTIRKYPIIIGSNLIINLSKILKENQIEFDKCLLIIDKKIPKFLIRKTIESLKNKKILIYYFNANELNKNQKNINKILNILLKNNFHRNDCLISVGGGITGDVSGFAASIFKRGMKFVNIPTTLLAQVDSSIGGKTGINSSQGKNLIGSFFQPNLVISDINFLKTLPRREIICGYGEIIKHALVADKKFFTFLDKFGSKILNLKSPYIEKSIYKSCSIKKNVVEKDEKESGPRKILNFGHSFAHAYEAALGYSKKLNHGEAVILGLKAASKFSFLNKILKNKELKLIENHLNKLDLPSDLNKFFSNKDLKKIIFFMKKDKKNYAKKLNLVLLKKIGHPIYNLQFNSIKIEQFLKKELIK
tara:strand:+ start:1304 stop:2410 length:1107 start_codon:yes stop_codon:yes gene_type:complete